MNVKEYINSGIVESYVLGLATDAERLEFEQTASSHAEVAEARDAFERSLEEQLLKDAVAPPLFIKEKIQQQIAPAVMESGTVEDVAETPMRRMSVWKLMAAACFVGLLAMGYWAYSTNEKYKDLEARQAGIENQLKDRTSELAAIKSDAETLYKPGMKMVSMKGTPEAPQAFTTVYWDTTGASKDVYLMINNLPQPASDKQYQLWALLDGKPIDLGLVNYSVREERLLLRMKNVQNAQAFAISLEKKGGSTGEGPQGGVYVLGKL